jgi:hypothetical protein
VVFSVPWLALLPLLQGTKGSWGICRQSRIFSLEEIACQVSHISLTFSQLLCQFAQVPLPLEFLWQNQRKAQAGFPELVSLHKYCHLVLPLLDLIAVAATTASPVSFQFNLGCLCHSFNDHNMRKNWWWGGVKKKWTHIQYIWLHFLFSKIVFVFLLG